MLLNNVDAGLGSFVPELGPPGTGAARQPWQGVFKVHILLKNQAFSGAPGTFLPPPGAL
jgi:hypothetical protein